MKFVQLLTGLFAGIAIGGTVVASSDGGSLDGAGGVNKEAVRNIVREVIKEEPKLIMDSVEKYARNQGKRGPSESSAMKDPATRAQILSDKNVGSIGPKDSKRVVVEFFDYNCPACKMQHQEIAKVIAQDKTVRVLFREYPIFGEASEINSRLGIAISRLAPERYYEYYDKMHAQPARANEAIALGIIKEMGLDVAKIQAESRNPEVDAVLDENRRLGDILEVRGTPTLVVGNEVIPHAAEASELLRALK